MKNNIQVVNFETCIKPARTSVLPLKAGQTFSAVSRERHPVTDNISIHLRSFISMNMYVSTFLCSIQFLQNLHTRKAS